MDRFLENADFDTGEVGQLTASPLEHDCEQCTPLVTKLNKESNQLKQKIKDLLQDRKEIFLEQEKATKQLNQSHLESTNKLLKQETTKWSVHTSNQKRQIENLNDKVQLYKTSKELVEDQLKNISSLIEMYQGEMDIDKKIDYKRQLYSLCGIVSPFDEEEERQQLITSLNNDGNDNVTNQKLNEYKATLKKVDECLAECQQQLLDPKNELQLENLKVWMINLVENSTLNNQLKKPIVDELTLYVSSLNYTLFMERVMGLLLNTAPNCYQQKSKYNNDLEQHKQLYEQKIKNLEQMCEINQKETLRASEEIQNHLKSEIARLKNSILTMEKGHMDDLKIMEERCRDFQQDIQSNLAQTKVLTCQFNEEKDELKSRVNSLRDQLDMINENRKELTNELASSQNRYNTQQEINKGLHHALNTLRNESSVQYQMILDQCEVDKKAIIKDCDEQIELLKEQLKSQNELESSNNKLKEEIAKLSDKINELKFRATSTTTNNNISSIEFDYDSTIIRILKSTLLAYHKAEPQKRHEVFSVLCGILGVSKDDINNIINLNNETHQEKSFVSNLPIIGRLWSNNNNDHNQTNPHNNDTSENSSFTSLLYSYLEKESNTPSLPKMSNSDIDSLVGAITQIDQQSSIISTTLESEEAVDTSINPTLNSTSNHIHNDTNIQPTLVSPQLNLSTIIEDNDNQTIEQ